MSIWKRVYCGLLAAWLLYCAGRAVLLCTGGYYKVHQKGKWITVYDPLFFPDIDVMQREAARYAELNARLEAAQPGTQFFYAPYTHSGSDLTYVSLLCSPAPGDTPGLTPEAEAVFTAWREENGDCF